MLKRLIVKLSNKQNLTIKEAEKALIGCTSPEASTAQIAALLTALKLKGETIDELTGFASAMRNMATPIKYRNHTYDCCGTGGDMASTINISTASAIVASCSGMHIAKHSNKSITSQSGSSDVLEELKISLSATPEDVVDSLDQNNIAFIHAPTFHQATSNVAAIRKDIGIRTIFNLLGPLTNPAKPEGQLIGVSSPDLCSIMIEVLRNLGLKRAMVVCSPMPRLDEISICGTTIIYELNDQTISNYEITPEDFNIERVTIDNIKGSTPANNAKIITDIFNNQITDARRDVIAMNSAALLWIAEKVDSLKDGYNLSLDIIKNSKAAEKLSILQQYNSN